MRYAGRILALLTLSVATILLASCGQKQNCSGITFGGSGGSGGGGTLNGGGSVCGSNSNGNGNVSATALVYYVSSGPVIAAAGIGTNTFTNVNGFTPISLSSSIGLSEDMVIAGTKFLYLPVQVNGAGAVEAYAINHATAALTAVTGSPFATLQVHTGPSATDPQGRFLFVAADGQIAVMQIDSTTGALTPAPGSPFAFLGLDPITMTVEGTGNYLYAANGAVVIGFSIDQNTGALAPIPGSPFGVAVGGIKADPSGKFLLGVDGLTPDLFVVTIESGTGVLQGETMVPTTNAPYALALSPKGTSVFTFSADAKGNPLPLEGFQLDTSGTATTLSGSPFTSLPNPRQGKFDQSGIHLVCPLSTSTFAAFTVDTTTGAISDPLPNLSTVTDFKFAITN